MKSKLGSWCAPRAARCIGLVLAAGIAAPVGAVDKSWNSDAGFWSTGTNWWPVGAVAPADRVFIGNIVGVHNTSTSLSQNYTVAQLTVSDGMRVLTNGFRLVVNGDTVIAEQNQVGMTTYSSAIHVSNAVAGADFETHSLLVSNGGVLYLTEGAVRTSDDITIGADAFVRGDGTIQIAGAGSVFVNEGRIEPGAGVGVIISHLDAGAINLDGVTGDGIVDLDRTGGATLSIQADRLVDSFSGTILMAPDSRLHMNIADGWAAAAASVINLGDGPNGSGPARITGTHASLLGHIETDGDGATLRIECDATFGASTQIDVGADDIVRTTGSTIIGGGEFVLGDGADLYFDGPTVVNAGEFQTFSNSNVDGIVAFSGETEWNGSVVIDGVARQLGAANVTGTTVINADVFDMDGLGGTTWDIEARLTINAGNVEIGSNVLDGVINVFGSLPSSLNVELADPAATWEVAGELNLTGNASLFFTRVTGSPLEVTGDLNIVGGRMNISAPTTLAPSSTLNIVPPTAIVRFIDSARIRWGTTINGAGTLQSGPAGELIIDDGVTTGSVGVVNQGDFRIDAEIGIVAVDRFETTGTWHVQVGGHGAGTGHDHLIVASGVAAVGGTIDVEVINGFEPQVGDTFTVLASAGGVSGAFPMNAVSQVDGWTYAWSINSKGNDVTLRLESVQSPCRADFNGDGAVNSQDFFDFLARFFAVDALADVNADGVVNSQDFFDFLAMFFNGCE